MFELDGDFDIDDAFLQDAFHQDAENLNHSALENEVGKRAFSEDEQQLCSKRNKVDSLRLLESSNDGDKCYGILECGQVFSNRFSIKNSHSTEKQISNSPEERNSEIATNRSTPDIFGAELPSPVASDVLSSDSITHNENSFTLSRDTPTKGTTVADLNHSIRQRKFPGPAGLLPDKNSLLSSKVNSPVLEQQPQEPLCSQRSIAVFEGAPWQKMLQDFGLSKKGSSPLEKFTVSWIKRRAAARQLVGQKVPFLAVVLQSIDCSSPDPCLVLRDRTGEIFGTLHRDVWEQHGGQLVVGAALVLRQAGVLSTGPAARRHYLNITSNNLLTIYAPTENEESVKETRLHEVSQEELIDAVKEWQASSMKTAKNLASASLSASGNSSQHGTTLWNTSGSGVHSLLSDRNNPLPLNRPEQEDFTSALSSRVHNSSLASVSSSKIDFCLVKKGANSSGETFLNERIFHTKNSDGKSQMHIHNSPASSQNNSRSNLEQNRASADSIKSGFKSTSVVNSHNFSPRISQSSTPKANVFNLKRPVSTNLALTPVSQPSESQRTCKFTPKVPNISLSPPRQSNEFIHSVPSCSKWNAAEGSFELPKACKFTPKVSNNAVLTPATESLGTPRSSRFTPKIPMVTQHMAPLSSVHNLSTPNPNSSFANNKSLKEEELDSILGGLDTSSLFDDDF